MGLLSLPCCRHESVAGWECYWVYLLSLGVPPEFGYDALRPEESTRGSEILVSGYILLLSFLCRPRASVVADTHAVPLPPPPPPFKAQGDNIFVVYSCMRRTLAPEVVDTHVAIPMGARLVSSTTGADASPGSPSDQRPVAGGLDQQSSE